ncbi:MAG: tyrosine-type recombinase/integrase [Candidatus Scalindua sp.]
MSKHEVQRVFVHMQRVLLLMARMLYGCGLRLMECIRLRVQNLDFDRNLVYVCAAKGGKVRTILFPKSIQEELRQHVEKVRKIHERNPEQGFGEVHLPKALTRKYPNACRGFRWQYVFPAKNLRVYPHFKIK